MNTENSAEDKKVGEFGVDLGLTGVSDSIQ